MVAKICRASAFSPCALAATSVSARTPANKPNILFIMGDDIGIMRPSIYHRGLMVRETPDIDRAGNDEVVVAQMQVRLDSI
jgi:hypothetical protein